MNDEPMRTLLIGKLELYFNSYEEAEEYIESLPPAVGKKDIKLWGEYGGEQKLVNEI